MYSFEFEKNPSAFAPAGGVCTHTSGHLQSLQRLYVENSDKLGQLSRHRYGSNDNLDIDIDLQISTLIAIQEKILITAAKTPIETRQDIQMLKLLWEKALSVEKKKPDLTDELIISLLNKCDFSANQIE